MVRLLHQVIFHCKIKNSPDCYQQPGEKDENQIRWMKWSPKTPI
uniref:Uncharacterized protein n=1 Tax=Siphoviridae sp. ctYKh4 TaxID=2823586 RepID=A0A8S5LCK6_9CAUD|nr:MAG TPA: hypothetical protein [Siphoviridae sp. ctYKh4]